LIGNRFAIARSSSRRKLIGDVGQDFERSQNQQRRRRGDPAALQYPAIDSEIMSGPEGWEGAGPGVGQADSLIFRWNRPEFKISRPILFKY
jgi:hypothetical protein